MDVRNRSDRTSVTLARLGETSIDPLLRKNTNCIDPEKKGFWMARLDDLLVPEVFPQFRCPTHEFPHHYRDLVCGTVSP